MPRIVSNPRSISPSSESLASAVFTGKTGRQKQAEEKKEPQEIVTSKQSVIEKSQEEKERRKKNWRREPILSMSHTICSRPSEIATEHHMLPSDNLIPFRL